MMKRNKQKAVIIIALVLGIWSCSDYENQDTPTSYSTLEILIEEGWADYANGDFASAVEKFEDATSRNAQETEAYIGKGWSQLRLSNYNQAIIEYNMVLNLATEFDDDESMADAYAGLFIIRTAERYAIETDPEQSPTEDDINNMMAESLAMGEYVLQYAPEYATEHDSDYASDDIHFMLAQSYYYLHRFQETLEHIKPVFGNTILEDNGIIVEGTSEVILPWVDMSSNINPLEFAEDNSLSDILLAGENIINILDITDENASSISIYDDIFNYLLENNQIILNQEYDFPSDTETLSSFKVSHAQPGAPSVNFLLLATSKYGIYEVSSVSIINIVDDISWYRVDTTGVQADTLLADGIYSESNTCCYFYSDTTQVEESTNVNSELWSPLDPATSLPVETVNIIEPSETTGTYNYNYIYLPDEDTAGEEYIVTYKYGSYTINYQTTDNYIEYLDFLNSLLSEP